MSVMSASEINAIKAAIKSEMGRRIGAGADGAGGLTSYSKTSYNFSENPTSGGIILAEHGQKTIDLLLKVKAFCFAYKLI